MKFAKELESELVPEWRVKYFDYKTGKKKLEAVRRALDSVNKSPRTPVRRTADLWHGINQRATSANSSLQQTRPQSHSFLNRRSVGYHPDANQDYIRRAYDPSGSGRPETSSSDGDGDGSDNASQTQPTDVKDQKRSSQSSSKSSLYSTNEDGSTNHSKSAPASPDADMPKPPSLLDLPEPAVDPDERLPRTGSTAWRNSDNSASTAGPGTPGDAYEIGRTKRPSSSRASVSFKGNTTFRPRRALSPPQESGSKPLMQRIFSVGNIHRSRSDHSRRKPDVPLQAYRTLDQRQAEFFHWMDGELEKIEDFYIEKEEEASDRLDELRNQLHEMRTRRLEEVVQAQRIKSRAKKSEVDEGAVAEAFKRGEATLSKHHAIPSNWLKPIENVFDSARGRPVAHFGKGTQALHDLGSPPGPQAMQYANEQRRIDSRRDSMRRPYPHEEVPYRSAKRKLKLALQEYYRGLELLKSYVLLNRTAFRKMNKKYDKRINPRIQGGYMAEKVNKAYFVHSEVLDGHLRGVEDLYARYFERGNHKLAVGKLRTTVTKPGEFNSSVYRNGVTVGAGVVFGALGIADAWHILSTSHIQHSSAMVINTEYLLQIYGGYFLSLLLTLLFCLNCRFWNANKINYVFIFEFDTRHHLDWRQLSELPCFLVFLEGLIIWLNFSGYGSPEIFIYYPVILIGLSLGILFFPAKVLYHRSRQWWIYSNGRLLLAGLLPVEFRDFFLGDMYCSQTYSLGNLELFFCLYAHRWTSPERCNSSNSKLFGFLTTMPAIIRAFQCLRRYYDTRNVFPHLINGGKYTFTILYYMSLSLWRIEKAKGPNQGLKTSEYHILFIFCAIVNSIYSSIWDLIMDWSLGNPYAKHPFLRDVLGYKRPWIYYLAMIIDPILRFNWIFYIIFENDIQHSAFLSFLVGLSEVIRRGMWTLFRVENEHCTNVGRFRASRDIPLPYTLEAPSTSTVDTIRPNARQSEGAVSPSNRPDKAVNRPSHQDTEDPLGVDLEYQPTNISGHTTASLRARHPRTPERLGIQRSFSRVGTMLSQAHAQDFERKRKPAGGDASTHEEEEEHSSSDEGEDEPDEDNENDVLEAERIIESRRRERAHSGRL